MMKPRYPSNGRPAARPAHRDGARHTSQRPAVNPARTAVALVDERYLAWLADEQGKPSAGGAAVEDERPARGPLQRQSLMHAMDLALAAAAPEVGLLRTYRYADAVAPDALEDVVSRIVPAHAQDGGLGLVRAMGQELTQLAQRGACGWVLVASDDERLIPYIDEAQWRGLRVLLLADQASADVARLMADDPSWARLLMQADRRVAMPAEAWAALTTPGYAPPARAAVSAAFDWSEPEAYRATASGEAGRHLGGQGDAMHTMRGEYGGAYAGFAAGMPDLPSPFERARGATGLQGQGDRQDRSDEPRRLPPNESNLPPTDDWRQRVQGVIEQWWGEETPDTRLDLYEEMQDSSGVPPETDRHLLLRVRRELDRTLSFPEKKAMREMIRATVLAARPDDEPASTASASAGGL